MDINCSLALYIDENKFITGYFDNYADMRPVNWPVT